MLHIRIQRALVRGPVLRTHFHTAHALLAARKVLHTFKLADIGEGITECEVIKWFVHVLPRLSASTDRADAAHIGPSSPMPL